MGLLDFFKPQRRTALPEPEPRSEPVYALHPTADVTADEDPELELRRIYSLGEVFTPGKPADKGFVSRPLEERDLTDLLEEEGTQILVWGESGAGKSSLVTNVLKRQGQRFITTRCEATTTYEQILASAFERISATQLTATTNQNAHSGHASVQIGGPLSPVVGEVSGERQKTRAEEFTPVVAAQLSSESLAIRLGAEKVAWLIEDFHKVAPEVRARVADAMKVFSDESDNFPSLRMIVLGVADSAAQILRAPSNMGGRLADIQLPPLDDDQLGELLDNALELLNVDFTPVRDQIIRHSVGVASITHALARLCCVAVGVRETSDERITITANALEKAKASYVRTRGAAMKEDFDAALEVTTTRKYHNYAIILKAMATLPDRGATHAEILAEIHKQHPQYPAGNLTTYLRKLQSEERGALLRKTSEGVFRYDRPLQHAYALLRFKVVANPTDEFWADNLSVSPEEQEEAVRLADEEHPDAPDDDEGEG